MREFQEKHQIVDLDSQARAVVSSVAARSTPSGSPRRWSSTTRGASAPRTRPATRQLESQLSVVDDAAPRPRGAARGAGATAAAPGGAGQGAGMFPAALAVPRLRAEYEKLYRDRKVAEATLVFALDRLEGARASEARDVSTFVVLDPPALPTRPARPPSLPVLAVLGLAAGLVAGVGLEAWRSQGRPGLASLKQALGPRSED